MTAFERLLEVQEHDSAIDRLKAQREKLPERAQLAERQLEFQRLEAQLAEINGTRDEVVREEKRFDDTVTALDQKIQQVEGDLYSGTISSPRELQALQADLDQLRRQKSSLEDQELDVMERREGLDAQVARLESEFGEVKASIVELEDTISRQEQEIDQQLADEQAARERGAASISEDLMKLYEGVRTKNKGVGAARLVGGTCQACHLALPAVEVDRIKREPADALIRCDQCGAILVRQ